MIGKFLNKVLFFAFIFSISFLLVCFLLHPVFEGKKDYLFSLKSAIGVCLVYLVIFIIKFIDKKKWEKDSYAIIKAEGKYKRIFYQITFYFLILSAVYGLISYKNEIFSL